MIKNIDQLKSEHTKDAIRLRLQSGIQHNYARDFVYGAIDGTVTTFAVVAGTVGAELSAAIVIILGLANVAADGVSMGISNFLAVRTEQNLYAKRREEEEKHISLVPEGEKEEVRQIFAAKGFQGNELENIVTHITSDYQLWINTMLQEEFGIPRQYPSAFRAGITTFCAFLAFGFMPIFPYLAKFFFPTMFLDSFLWSISFSFASFFIIGSFKHKNSEKKWFISGFETLLLGGIASAISYFIGMSLKSLMN